MAIRKDITVDLVNPRTVTDHTAVAILTALQGLGWVYTQDIDYSIVQTPGANLMHKPDAFKALRNMGHPIASVKARHESRYRLNAGSDELEEWRTSTLREAYTQFVTATRSLVALATATPNDPLLRQAHLGAEQAAVNTGRALGKTLAEIARDLVPL